MPPFHPKTNAAIVLGLTANGLGILRSLGRYGVTCYGLYCSHKTEVGCYSKYLQDSIQVRQHWNDDDIIKALNRLFKKATDEKPVLFATSDHFAWFIAKNQAVLREKFLFYSPDTDLLALLTDKSNAPLLSQFGILTPFTITPKTTKDLVQFDQNSRFPAVLKPLLANNPKFPGKVIPIHDFQELLAFFEHSPNLLGKCIVQKMVPGGDEATWGVASFSNAKTNTIHLLSMHKIRQYPPGTGLSSFIKTEVNACLESIVTEALIKNKYSGLADWDFIYDSRTLRYYLVDINCRSGMTNQICADAGMDLTRMAYDSLTTSQLNPNLIITPKNNLYYLNLEWDIGSFFRKKQAGDITTLKWLKSLLKVRSFAFFSLTDPVPFFVTISKIALLTGKKITSTFH